MTSPKPQYIDYLYVHVGPKIRRHEVGTVTLSSFICSCLIVNLDGGSGGEGNVLTLGEIGLCV